MVVGLVVGSLDIDRMFRMDIGVGVVVVVEVEVECIHGLNNRIKF